MAFTLVAPHGASAQDTLQDKENAEGRLGQIAQEIKDREAQEVALRLAAQKAADKAAATSQNLVAAARSVQEKETQASSLEENIAQLTVEEAKKSKNFDTHRQDLVELLATLERLGNRPSALALMQPTKALDTVRTASLLATLVPQIEARASDLRRALDILKGIRSTLEAEKTILDTTLNDIRREQDTMKELLRRQRLQAKQATTEANNHARAIKKLAQEAKDLTDLITKITAENRNRNTPENIAKMRSALNFGTSRGALILPARGRVIERFGTRLAVGTAKGMRLETRSNAQVVAPFDGEVIFADSFRDYGLILIIAHGSEYHTLISGLGESYPLVGQWVVKGEPIGAMAPNHINTSGKTVKPRLYLEVRKKSVPINPAPWFEQ